LEDLYYDNSLVLGKYPRHTAIKDECGAFAQIVNELINNAVHARDSIDTSSRFHQST